MTHQPRKQSTRGYASHVDLLSSFWKLVQPHTTVRQTFESVYRENLCNFNFVQYIDSGTEIPTSTKIRALQAAAQAAAAHASTTPATPEMQQLAAQLWNPIVASVFQSMDRARGKPQPSGPSVRQDSARAPTNRVPPEPLVPAYDERAVLSDLNNVISNRMAVFYPKRCSIPGCQQCLVLFSNLVVSVCKERHSGAPCLPCGYYPHLAARTWTSVSGLHATGSLLYYCRRIPGQGEFANPLPAVDHRDADATIPTCSEDSFPSEAGAQLPERFVWADEADRVVDLSAETKQLTIGKRHRDCKRSRTRSPSLVDDDRSSGYTV